MAAHALDGQSNAVVAPPPHFVVRRVPTNPRFGVVPLQHPFGVINPFPPLPFRPPVLAPLGLFVNPSVLAKMDEERSMSLLQYMVNEGLVPSPEEEDKRRHVIRKLRRIISTWVKKVAWQHRLPRQQIQVTHAILLTYGSYGLGVHDSESDIDALCVGPFFATMAKDFFITLHNMLRSRPEVSEIHCVKDAKVPLMRFKFDGISIDLPYAQLKLLAVPESVDVLNPFFLRNIDETSWKSLSGVRANKRILQLVPNLEKFQSLLRCVKLWAKRRGVYGNLLGFLGGVHLAILAAYVCQLHPHASINALVTRFFEIFGHWPWPTPVKLQDGTVPTMMDATEIRSFMPIRLPCNSFEYCHSNITRSTFYKIRAELLRGNYMTRDLLMPDFDWNSLFEPFPYSKKYSRFVKVFLSAHDQDQLGDWVGWVKSRFRSLLLKLEEVQGCCDPNPTEHVDFDVELPNVVFYWGLQPSRGDFKDIESVEVDFMKSINNGYQGNPGKLELSIVQASQLPKNAVLDDRSERGRKTWWKIPDSDEQGILTRPQRVPNFLVGYVETNSDSEYPSAGG